MKLTEHTRTTLRNKKVFKHKETRPYINVTITSMSVPNHTVKFIGLTINSGILFAHDKEHDVWYVTFSEPKAEKHYGFYGLKTQEVSLGSACIKSQAEDESLKSPLEDGLVPERYFLGAPIEQGDQLWYPLQPDKK